MSFRSNLVAQKITAEAEDYLTRNFKEVADREEALANLRSLYGKLGPAINGYPTWHPLLRSQPQPAIETTPNERCGYEGLDHTVCFRNGFITCPYSRGKDVIESVNRMNETAWYSRRYPGSETPGAPEVRLEATILPFKLYHPNATAIMVVCDWDESQLEEDGTIEPQTVFSLLLEREGAEWRDAEYAEPWETMRPYLLGTPCGARSSLFVNQNTGQAIKTVYKTLINAGASGKLDKVRGKIR